jgi:DNA-binding beta-propeller fold protein YncE
VGKNDLCLSFAGVVGRLPEPGAGNGRFRRPVALAFDSAGNVYVSNQAGNSVQKFAPPPLP